MELRSSGNITFPKAQRIDIFCVGGGAGGFVPSGIYGAMGGGGGYTKTFNFIPVAGKSYPVVIGAGGAGTTGGNNIYGGPGGATSLGEFSVNGGMGGHTEVYGSYQGAGTTKFVGGNGGSGGGANADGATDGGTGLEYLPSSTHSKAVGGTGQGTTTREFGESTGRLYSGGGNGNYGSTGTGGTGDALSNTGNGGGAKSYPNRNSYAGGSGIVCIRLHKEA